jgi:histidine triad (HIT) family protein
MNDCLFCKISSGQIAANLLYEDDTAVAFPDINPKAPVHILVVPKKHISSFKDCAPEDHPALGHLLWVVSLMAAEKKIDKSGYRVIINSGPDSGQEIDHVHLHLLGGRPLGRMIEQP